tara:strand:+ start:545 stop:1627 length:1083 start_codon:yes stop_codon:yes gene_type:complete
MRFSDILRNLRSVFERKRKNPIQLEQDSNLENNLKFLKVDTKSTPIQISEDSVNINGSLTVNNSSVQTGSDAGATELNELSDVTYSSGDLTITSLDTIVAGGSLALDVADDIELNADGGNITFKDALATVIDFDLVNKRETVYFDAFNYFRIIVSANAATGISTTDADGEAGHLEFSPDGSLIFNPKDGKYIAKKDGTEFSATDSAYAGMILGYTDIGLDEADATYNLTTSYAVPTSEFSVTFVAPPSGNVEIYIQIQFDNGSAGAGDLYAGLSDNATYNAVEDFHEVELKDGGGRGALETVVHSWTLTGLTAGTSYERWVGFKSSSTSGTPNIKYGSNATGEYPDFIMKAIALPATIST